jgi:hypothetical protein
MVYVFCLVYSPSYSLASSASSAEVDWFAPSSIYWLSTSFKASSAVAVFLFCDASRTSFGYPPIAKNLYLPN